MAIGAGFPEEFMRLLAQSRIGAAARNPAAGWIASTTLWAALHIPAAIRDGAAHPWVDPVRMIPLGLLYGYLSHRARGFVPAAVIHCMNVWGLQNLG